MANRIQPGGNGSPGNGLIDASPVCEGCTLFGPNPTHPPPDADVPFTIAEVLQKWMLSNTVRVRDTLPVVSGGNTVGLFVWWDRVG